MPIAELGHVGIHVNDFEKMRTFYTQTMGLQISDEDRERQICFMSARPGVEHHEFVIMGGRNTPEGTKMVQQISFRVDSMDTLRNFHKTFNDLGIKINQEVSHGNAYGLYFFDPEGNNVEVYLANDLDVQQPFVKPMDFGASADEIDAAAAKHLEDDERYRGPSRAAAYAGK